jgi:hypothetical protein
VALESCVVLEAVVVAVLAVAEVVVWVEMLCASISLELAIRIRHLLHR